MRITYAITKPTWGGAQTYVHALAVAAKSQGHEVSAITGSSNAPLTELSDRLATAGIPVASLPSLGRDIGIVSDWRALLALVRELRHSHPDALHLNSSKMGLLGAIAGQVAGVPRIVFTAHGWPHREPRSFIWKLLVWVGSFLTVLFSHTIIVVSDRDLKDSPALLMRRKLVRILNGIGTFEMLSRNEARAQMLERAPGLSDFSTWLLMNAELHRNKGIDVAIRAIANISDVVLVVCGDGEERRRLENLASKLGVSDRVFLLGFVTDARRYLRAANIYLMPSRKEGLPMALLEASIAGLPVIASSTGGIPEIVEDGVSGLLVPAADTKALTEAIRSLVADPARTKTFGTALAERVSSRFSEQRMLDATFETYSR